MKSIVTLGLVAIYGRSEWSWAWAL